MEQTIHPFEAAGLGKAPFNMVGFSEKVYSACPGAPEQAAGSCDYCGTGIKYQCHIRSSDGRDFVVGTDCVMKLDRADNRLISQANKQIALAKQAKKNAERQARMEAIAAAGRAEDQAQRERNGGLTDREKAEAERKAKAAAVEAEMREKNGWLLKVLERRDSYGEFVPAMVAQLKRVPAAELPNRALGILEDIFAKAAGRRGSKPYKAAVAEFRSKAGIPEQEGEGDD